jgi:DNA-binding LacI/PurR family transcriptional regulator
MISSGELSPSARLPSARALAKEWSVNYVSAHKALALLAREGVLERRSKLGTFIRENRLLTIGILCGRDLNMESSHYYRALVRALQSEIERAGVPVKWSSKVYSGLLQSEEMGGAPGPDLARLQEDLAAGGLGARIAIDLDPKRFTPPAGLARLPVVLSGAFSDVTFDYQSFASDSAAFLFSKGRRKIVFVSKTGSSHRKETVSGLEKAAREAGLPPPPVMEIPYRWDFFGVDFERAAFQAMTGWIDGWRRGGVMPDGIISEDDIGMRGLALALIKQNVRVPDETKAVCLSNEGIAHHYGIPVVRYEMPLGLLAAKTVGLLRLRVSGCSETGSPIALKGAIREDSNS